MWQPTEGAPVSMTAALRAPLLLDKQPMHRHLRLASITRTSLLLLCGAAVLLYSCLHWLLRTTLAPLTPTFIESVQVVDAVTRSGAQHHLTPVVFLHGMGDSGSNPGMAALCQSASDAYPGLYVLCANVANGFASITTPLSDQVHEFAQLVGGDQALAGGFIAVGLSQGGLVLRGYTEQHNDPPVRRLITICTPHEGVSACPASPLFQMFCPFFQFAPYSARLAFSDYWKDPSDQTSYLQRSRWLADVNNEREEKASLYRDRMCQIERYVLVEALDDTVVIPHESSSHGYFAWGGRSTVLTMRQMDGYAEDVICLRTLDEEGRLFVHRFPGDHLQFTHDFWWDRIIPHLGPG